MANRLVRVGEGGVWADTYFAQSGISEMSYQPTPSHASPTNGADGAPITDEAVHAMCAYLSSDKYKDGCFGCPRIVETPYGPGERGCFGLALETLERAREFDRPAPPAQTAAVQPSFRNVDALGRGDHNPPIGSLATAIEELQRPKRYTKDRMPMYTREQAVQRYVKEESFDALAARLALVTEERDTLDTIRIKLQQDVIDASDQLAAAQGENEALRESLDIAAAKSIARVRDLESEISAAQSALYEARRNAYIRGFQRGWEKKSETAGLRDYEHIHALAEGHAISYCEQFDDAALAHGGDGGKS